ncbi:hypothetical protein [Roseivirga sp. UBA838]|uniref:hypothetical protein n=1 Tax=Roseivirga sp. UBA838 TaxID=1947393 RepID=UPI00258068FF|nr:hypothetical protein [Roseivirga sp. UBA838]|tara:strand:+ start:4053 stop:4457 length:405 start_codon:yes stop_codon:yes gene_type:complete
MNHKQFFAVIKQHGIDKADIVEFYTEGRTSSIREMKPAEQAAMMEHIKSLNGTQPDYWKPGPGDKQRKALMGMAYKMRWAKPGDHKACIAAIDTWALQQKYKKALAEHTEDELNTLVTIMRHKVLPSFLAGLNK